jgi:hypothetical protein
MYAKAETAQHLQPTHQQRFALNPQEKMIGSAIIALRTV